MHQQDMDCERPPPSQPQQSCSLQLATHVALQLTAPDTANFPNRKHRSSRFSLGRLFRNLSLRHRNESRKRPVLDAEYSRSESSSLAGTAMPGESKQPLVKDSYNISIPEHCSADVESNSLSSGHSDGHHACQPSHSDSVSSVECPLCLLELPLECFPALTACPHRACFDCLQQYLKIEISESRVNISCPQCTEPIHPNDIRLILNDENFISKYERFMLRRILITEPDARWCPAPDCGYVVVASGCASCPQLKCERPGCGMHFCYHCKQEWHPNQTCDAARAQRANHSPHQRSSSMSFSQESFIHRDDIKPCPCCKVLIIKMDDGSCNHMTCSVCGTEFCWLCMKEISDLHYLSPSGCTFWGKKPWSRKKKIMWQLGMLIGAPVGIALIAGIAVPAIIIGIPVWVGRKLHAKYDRQTTSKHKRNLAVTGSVIASVLVSPILAGIAVGIGVPILLAYVYGVVPISLCRSGGCGVTTSASGVRIEFDEENEMDIGNNIAPDGVSVDTAASHRGANPSIGEVSFGMSTSLSLGSGSHLDRLGVMRDRDSDRESASNTALAGSIASSMMAGNLSNKLEVQADVSSNKRFSLSSHSETASATVSLSERSANLSLLDDCSTRALAGSITGYRDGTTSAITPVEVHINAQDEMGFPSMSSEEGNLSSYTESGMDSCDSQSQNVDFSQISLPYSEDNSISSNRSGSYSKWKRMSGRRQASAAPSTPLADVIPESLQDSAGSSSYNYTDLESIPTQQFKDWCVTFIDESLSSLEGAEANMKSVNSLKAHYINDVLNCEDEEIQSLTSKSVSIQNTRSTSRNKRSTVQKYESKSLDHLVSYCEICQKIHRPCCPNAFVHNVTKGNCPFTESIPFEGHHRKRSTGSAENNRGKIKSFGSPKLYSHKHKNSPYSTMRLYDVGPKGSRSCSTVYERGNRCSLHNVNHFDSAILPYVEEPEVLMNFRSRPHSAPYPLGAWQSSDSFTETSSAKLAFEAAGLRETSIFN